MFDVIIIGAGVSGLAQALTLSQAGLAVAVVDHELRPALWQPLDGWDNRVFALTRASQRFLESLTVWSELQDRRLARYETMDLAWLGFAERTVHLSAAMAAEPDLGHVVEQSVLRDALLARCEQAEHCVFYWGQSWQDVQLANEGATLKLASGQSLQAALIIAADGARSRMRQQLAVTDLSWSAHAKAIVTTLACERAHQQTARQWFLDSGTLALLPLADPHVCSLVWSLPEEQANSMQALSALAFTRALMSKTDQSAGQLSLLTERMSFPLQSLINQDFAQAGLAFIADAAHVIHPLAGQGLNLGLADIECLTSILIKAKRLRRPLGHVSILKPYARARRAAALQMVTLMTLLEKTGQFSGRHASLVSKLASLNILPAALLKVFSTTFALHSLTK